jgi:glycosyltransferase involved in cell wall biosynthesis
LRSEHRRSSGDPIDLIDIFVDLSSRPTAGRETLDNLVERWAHPDSLGSVARRVTVAVAAGTLLFRRQGPPGWVFVESTSPIGVLSAAIAAAGQAASQLLLLTGPVHVSSDTLGVLRHALDRDPMLGFAVPRIACTEGCCFARLSRHGVGTTDWLPRRLLAELPDTELLVEVAGPCVLIGSGVTGNFAVSGAFTGATAAMLDYMAAARRSGFRTVLSHRALVSLDDVPCGSASIEPIPAPSGADLAILEKLAPDLDRSWRELRAGSRALFERLCTRLPAAPGQRRPPSLLLDVRNVGAIYNGTTQAVLRTVTALKEMAQGWEVSLLATPQGAAFHDLKRLYADWPVYTEVPDCAYTVALRPSQPWHIREMVDLHNLSLFNAYLVLDTIAWDVAYVAPPRLEGTWQFLASHADALLFDSAFTQERFLERFPAATGTPAAVTHFSFDPAEYVTENVPAAAGGDEFILVVGNNLEHKDVPSTVEALTSAFPFRHIKALGGGHAASRFVTALRSGELPQADLHRLYANAQFVVFPSFYEGFGFPILTALAYGRTVLVRRSALVEEVAAQCPPRGRLIVFERREELVELIGRLVHGQPVPEFPLGRGLANGAPRRWIDVARDVLRFLEPLAARPHAARWMMRERAIGQLLAFRT